LATATGGAGFGGNPNRNPPVVFDETKLVGNCANAYTLVRRWNATDDAGNSVNATSVIHVVDETPPLVAGSSDQSTRICLFPQIAGISGVSVPVTLLSSGAAAAVDQCGGLSETYCNPLTVTVVSECSSEAEDVVCIIENATDFVTVNPTHSVFLGFGGKKRRHLRHVRHLSSSKKSRPSSSSSKKSKTKKSKTKKSRPSSSSSKKSKTNCNVFDGDGSGSEQQVAFQIVLAYQDVCGNVSQESRVVRVVIYSYSDDCHGGQHDSEEPPVPDDHDCDQSFWFDTNGLVVVESRR
jgi:hypothetical protein